MEPTPRDQLPYTDADVRKAEERLRMMCLRLPEVIRPAYVGHRGWIGLRLDVDPDWEEVEKVVRDAYRTVAPKTLVRQLD